jgi:3-methyladenine DNA glycosylase AlkD
MNVRILREELRKSSSPSRAKITKSFFKTAEGEYGHGDVFIGVRIPDIRRIAVRFKTVPLDEVITLFKSDIHEERLLALIFLVERFKKSDSVERKKIVRLYLQHKSSVNNWDLVDLSAPYILGAFTFDQQSVKELEKLLRSRSHWDRRMAMVATWYHIRQGETKLVFRFASLLLSDKEDLMHKATGWMLREAGKRDLAGLKAFINRFGKRMPRTMLRYAIEKFALDERKKILLLTKN